MTQWNIEGSSGRALRIKHDPERKKITLKIETAEGATQFTCQEDALRMTMQEIFPPPKVDVVAGTKATGDRKTS